MHHRFVLATCISVFLLAPIVAQAQDERDDDIFGSEPSEDTVDRNHQTLGHEERLNQKLEEESERTQIGGFLYLRMDYGTYEDGEPGKYPTSSPALFDVYLDSRPTDRLRAYARGRIVQQLTSTTTHFDFLDSQSTNTQASLDQLWLKFDVARALYLTVGKQPIRWGSGRFWNPTDFMQAQIRNPLAVFDARQGVSLVKVHVPIEHLGWNLYGIVNLQDLQTPSDVAGALRAEFLWDTTEVSLSAAARNKGLRQVGIDFSSALFDFDIRGELALSNRVQTAFFDGSLNETTRDLYRDALLGTVTEESVLQAIAMGELVLPQIRGRKNDWIVQAVFGAELALKYSDEDSLILGIEYFYNDAGYDDASIYPWLMGIASGAATEEGLHALGYDTQRLQHFDTNSAFKPLYLGRHYLAASVVAMAPGSWNHSTIVLSGLVNLSDLSAMARLDYRQRVLTRMDLGAYLAVHTGEIGEFRMEWPVDNPDGSQVFSPQFLDIGISARLSF